MDSDKTDYHSYLLRLWRVRNDGENWRASLEDVQTGELHGFQDLAALQRFLEGLAISESINQVAQESQSNQDKEPTNALIA